MMRNFGSEKRENLTVPRSSFEIFMNSDLSIDSAPNRDMACKIGCGLFLSWESCYTLTNEDLRLSSLWITRHFNLQFLHLLLCLNFPVRSFSRRIIRLQTKTLFTNIFFVFYFWFVLNCLRKHPRPNKCLVGCYSKYPSEHRHPQA